MDVGAIYGVYIVMVDHVITLPLWRSFRSSCNIYSLAESLHR